MKLSLLQLLFLSFCFTGMAQETHFCAQQKMNQANKQLKKYRAGATDNALMAKYDVHHYFLDLNIERNTTVISGKVTISAKTIQAMDTFAFELNSALTIDSIIFNNANTNFAQVGQMTYVPVSTLSTNSLFDCKVYYHGDASLVGSSSALGDGFTTDTSPSWGNEVTWSLSEPYSAYEWFPCKQFLEDKADSATVYVTTSNENKVGSNGVLIGIESLPNNKVKYKWHTNYIIDYYLISVAVAKYVDYTIYAHPLAMPGDSIKIVNYVYDNPNTLPAFQSKIDSVANMLEYYSDIMGLYPFANEKYGHAMAPISGGMEHQTMSTMGNLGSFRINAHELFHQWWGNHVTCKTWGDIFINEGFASYGEYLAYEHFRGLTAANNLMSGVHSSVLSEIGGSIYFTDTTSNRIFDSRLSYDKGNAVVHTLRYVLGDAAFFQALKNFQTQYAFSNASISDLKQSVENSTSSNLTDFFNQWLYGQGYPKISAEFNSTNSLIHLKLTQVGSSVVTPLFKTPIDIKFHTTTGDTTVKVNMNALVNNYQFPSNRKVDSLKIDPDNWILNKVGTIEKNDVLLLNDNTVESKFNIYPNPIRDIINIVTKEKDYTIKLIDAVGHKLIETKNVKSINTSTYSSGVYFLEIKTPQGSVIKKISKL